MSDFEFKEPEDKPAKPKKPAAKSPEKVETVDQLQNEVPKYEDSELEAVFDALMFDGSYVETVKVGRRLSATFRSRTGKQVREVMALLDRQGFQMGITMESFRSLYSLAQSLQEINGSDISGEDLTRKIERIEDLPSAVVAALISKLVLFEMKVEAAVRHGEENF